MGVFSRLAVASLLAGGLLGTPVSAGPAGDDQCDQQCEWQWQWQRANALPRTAFYDPPNPLPWAEAGTLIREEETSAYRVGGAPVTATRILYHSRTSAGQDVAASGVVLVPPGTPPAGGWPVVVDAHGSSGTAVDCAPSLMRDLYHGDQMSRFVAAGYAVVAPDYAGLGTTGRHEFLNKTAATNDVLGAVRAARAAHPELSARWVSWGHSQGGGAALAVAERQAAEPDPGYLGAVVTSPGADLAATVESIVATPGLGGFIPLVVTGARVTDPGIDPGRLLSGEALGSLPVVRTGCLGVVISVYSGLSGTGLVRPGYLSEPGFAAFLSANSTGREPVGGPVLLLQGDADTAIPRHITDSVAAGLCRAGAELDYRVYPGLGHDTYPGVVTGIDDGAMDDILAWTADRFAGRAAGSTCS